MDKNSDCGPDVWCLVGQKCWLYPTMPLCHSVTLCLQYGTVFYHKNEYIRLRFYSPCVFAGASVSINRWHSWFHWHNNFTREGIFVRHSPRTLPDISILLYQNHKLSNVDIVDAVYPMSIISRFHAVTPSPDLAIICW